MKCITYTFLATAATVAAQGPYGPPAGVLTTISGTVYIIGGVPATYSYPYGTALYGSAPFVYSVDGKLYSAGPGIGAPTVLPTDQPKLLPTVPVTATMTPSSSSSSSSSSTLTTTTSVIALAAEVVDPATEIGDDPDAVFTTVAPNGAEVVVKRAAAIETLLTSTVGVKINGTSPVNATTPAVPVVSSAYETSAAPTATASKPATGEGAVARVSTGLLAGAIAAAAFFL